MIYFNLRWKAELYNEFEDKSNQRHGLFRKVELELSVSTN